MAAVMSLNVRVLDLEGRLSSEEDKVTNLNSSVSQLKQRVEELLVSVQTERERTRLAGEEKMKLVRITYCCSWHTFLTIVLLDLAAPKGIPCHIVIMCRRNICM